MSTHEVTPHRCDACGRVVLVVGPHTTRGDLRCKCGAELVATALEPGLYELHELSHGRGKAQPEEATRLKEADHGYGESHGYGPAHGGPTGPGDAPAPAAATPREGDERPRHEGEPRRLKTRPSSVT
jgi:hypothetical protein